MLKLNYLFYFCLFLVACKNDPANKTEQNQTNSSATEMSSSSEIQSNSEMGSPSPSVPQSDNIISNSNNSSPNNPIYSNNNNTQANSKSTINESTIIKYGEPKTSESSSTIIPDEPKTKNGKRNLPIPDPANLISTATIKSIFKLTENPEVKAGSAPKPTERSTFFKFDDPGKMNGGIMLQILTNPIPDDVDDFPSLIIESKIKDGEMTPYDKTPKKFKPWNELGNGGCYSFEAGKYHWKIDDRYVFMLAFNTSQNEAEQKAAALTLGREIMSNFAKSLK